MLKRCWSASRQAMRATVTYVTRADVKADDRVGFHPLEVGETRVPRIPTLFRAPFREAKVSMKETLNRW